MVTVTAVLAIIALLVLAGAAGWGISLVIVRKRYRRLAALASSFDPGSAKIDRPDGNYFPRASVVGLFQGRPTSVTILSGVVRISVAGRFVLPFQVRPKRFSMLGVLRRTLFNTCIGLYFLILIPREFLGPALVWRFAAAPVLVGIALISVWRNYGRIGDVEFPSSARMQVSFPGSAAFRFGTDFPSDFSAMIGRADIQTSLLRLMTIHRIDHLRAVAQFRPGEWDSRLEANFFYRSRLLDPAVVRQLLSNLLALCEQIETSGRMNDAVKTVVTQPA